MQDLDYSVLVNREHPLRREYVPNNLHILDDNKDNFHGYLDPELKPMLRLDIIGDLSTMMQVAFFDGVEFIVDSGYRSYDYQQKILEHNIMLKGYDAYKTVALPGCSEHQTGLAFDIAYFNSGFYNDKVLETDEAVRWLIENGPQFGFILRYPKGKEEVTGFSFEPWHYRYVGKELAMTLARKKITLDEYYK